MGSKYAGRESSRKQNYTYSTPTNALHYVCICVCIYVCGPIVCICICIHVHKGRYVHMYIQRQQTNEYVHLLSYLSIYTPNQTLFCRLPMNSIYGFTIGTYYIMVLVVSGTCKYLHTTMIKIPSVNLVAL